MPNRPRRTKASSRITGTVDAAGRAQLQTMTTIAQVRALANPLRLHLLELFAAEPRTTKQVGALLGGNPTRLYYHVNALATHGLLRLVETRRNRGTVEKYFQTAARQINVDQALFAGHGRSSGLAAVATMLFDQARDELLEASRTSDSRRPDHLPVALRAVLSATPEQYVQLRRDVLAFLGRAVKRIRDGRPADRKGTRRYALTVGLMPVAARRAGSKPAAPPRGRHPGTSG